MLTLTDLTTAQQPEDKPAYLVYGNIHAIEACGVHCALHNAQSLLQDERELLERIVVYIVPRLAVDGAEFFVNTGSRVRSRLWDGASTQDYKTQPYDAARGAPDGVMLPNTLYPADVNGNGWVAEMRQERPDGGFVVDPEEPRLLIKRRPDSPPPYYKLLPEGLIHDWDGGDHYRRQETRASYYDAVRNPRDWDGVDWNRQWPSNWATPTPGVGSAGAGDYPFSEHVSRHDIVAIWVAFFSRSQRYRR